MANCRPGRPDLVVGAPAAAYHAPLRMAGAECLFARDWSKDIHGEIT